ncbi:hypothetical protein J8273_6453 [Carpediemonas membranifera]|uniref:Chromo domain-containing protein n=1 Tax=Carpediemonas membranifera TaxID=201153 RepID=A0A8J6B2N3_9EUKA|nr:hypothetical protein J8273_6453 [Carpediemonas membranifera]|eukprot:KAG9391682.1 hypothetical protein J8273_6453 [Carpediemonas membranifera]
MQPWDEHLPSVELILNSKQVSSTKASPLDILFPFTEGKADPSRLKAAREALARYAAKKAAIPTNVPPTHEPGSLVLLLRPKSAKIEANWRGPFRYLRRGDHTSSSIIQHITTDKTMEVSDRRIKAWTGSTDLDELKTLVAEQEGEYAVDHIVSARRPARSKTIYLLVHWAGCESAEDSEVTLNAETAQMAALDDFLNVSPSWRQPVEAACRRNGWQL